MKVTRWFLPVAFAILLVLTLTVPVAASVPQPTTFEIQGIEAFENTQEDDDQLYLVQYYISVNTTYNAQQLFIFRLFDEDDNEIANARPYPYNNSGFGMGVVSFYVEAEEAPDWQSGVYVKVVGNPLIDWDGATPSVSSSIITWNTGTQSEMQIAASGKILSLASQLTIYWGEQMTTTTQGVTVLTDYGAVYFLNVVPYLGTVAPYCLGQYTFTPDYPIDEKPAPDDYAEWLETSIEGTVFDLGPVARARGWDANTLRTGFYYTFVIGLFVLLIMKKKLNKGTMLLFWPFVVAGAFFGVPLSVTIIAGFFCLISTVWVFYKGTT